MNPRLRPKSLRSLFLKKQNSLCWLSLVTQTIVTLQTSVTYAETPTRTPQGAGQPLSQAFPGMAGDNRHDNSAAHNSPYFDDDGEDDDEDYFPQFPSHPGAYSNRGAPPPHPGNTVNHPTFGNHRSGGGMARSEGTDPVRTAQGISVGGQTPNGVIPSKAAVEPMKVDDETAEGSKELVTDFNFPDADILDIAKTLGKLTGKNFILDKEVKGRVSIITNSPITVSQAWKLFLTALDVNGFALVPSGAYLRIAKQRDARDKQLKTYTGDFSPDTDALITRVFSLKYISADEVTRTFRSLMPATSRIIGYDQTNTVIVTDTGSNIARLAKLLEILDVEGFDAGIEVVPVKYASAAELSKLIDALIPGTAAGTGGSGAPPLGRMGGGRFNARRTKEGGIINTIIADERTNTLIVHANAKGTDQVRELVAKLDLKVPTSLGGGKVRVRYLEFADAEQVANTLNNFSSQARSQNPSGGGGSSTGTNPIAGSLFEGSIKISPDKATNSLVINASPSDFVTVQRVINQLDIPREQVYVEVVLMEVALERGLNTSANMVSPAGLWGSTPGGSDDLGFLANGPAGMLTSLPNGALSVIPFPGATQMSIQTPGGAQSVPSAFGIIKAAQNNQNTSILATPQIIALDNTEATFESSEKIPVPSTNNIQGAGAVTSYNNTIPVTTSIKIKPQINKIINFVKMDVTVKLGDIDNSHVPANVKANAVGTTERSSQTTVLIGDSDTVVLGGLVRDKAVDKETKVPLLGDIPIIGWLFKAKSTAVEKRNLLIFLTPHIIRQYDKVRTILDKKLKERDEFIESTSGGTDPLRYQRDAMIRSLPNLKELAEKHPPTTVTLDDDKPTPEATKVAPAVALPPSGPMSVPLAPTPAPAAAPRSEVAPAPVTPPAPPPHPDPVVVAAPQETAPAPDVSRDHAPVGASPPMANPVPPTVENGTGEIRP